MFGLVAPLLFAMSAAPAPASAVAQSPVAQDIRRAIERAASNAEGCVVTPLSCDVTARGRLGVGDCTLSTDGTYFDTFTFAGTAGKLVFVDVRPISPTLTNPSVIIVPPA